MVIVVVLVVMPFVKFYNMVGTMVIVVVLVVMPFVKFYNMVGTGSERTNPLSNPYFQSSPILYLLSPQLFTNP
jgi:hypothetical protein